MNDLTRDAWGWGLANIHQSAGMLDTWYPSPALGNKITDAPDWLVTNITSDQDREVSVELVKTQINLDNAPTSVADAYLRLHLLSHRLVKPRTINLDGIFSVLPNVVWTCKGPCAVQDFERTRARLRKTHGAVQILGVDKFPRMTDYVLPTEVRIADTSRVRLGAYLASGTTVMQEGFVNFNAGTLGASMVEGRISAGVIVDVGSDIGGGASIMGTLSGGGSEQISIGKGCLLGAESGIGISLGDGCVVEAGLYITAGTKVILEDGKILKARELSGVANILFIRDSLSGKVRAIPRNRKIELNPELHKN